jgi:hypothetical protein
LLNIQISTEHNWSGNEEIFCVITPWSGMPSWTTLKPFKLSPTTADVVNNPEGSNFKQHCYNCRPQKFINVHVASVLLDAGSLL